jgi:4-carboxymuconolactone decarboxylase
MKKGPDKELFDRGLAVRREVLGAEHVEAALRSATPFSEDLQVLITQYAWGGVWARPGLDRRTRSMLTIALLAALGHHEELELHIRATRNTGVTRDEVKEVLLQTAVYAGVPAANAAFRHANRAYEALDESAEESGP